MEQSSSDVKKVNSDPLIVSVNNLKIYDLKYSSHRDAIIKSNHNSNSIEEIHPPENDMLGVFQIDGDDIGFRVYAKQEINAETDICIYDGELITRTLQDGEIPEFDKSQEEAKYKNNLSNGKNQELTQSERTKLKSHLDKLERTIGNYAFIVNQTETEIETILGHKKAGIASFVNCNHSGFANVVACIIKPKKQIVFRTTKKIQEGEEILFDYGNTYIDSENFKHYFPIGIRSSQEFYELNEEHYGKTVKLSEAEKQLLGTSASHLLIPSHYQNGQEIDDASNFIPIIEMGRKKENEKLEPLEKQQFITPLMYAFLKKDYKNINRYITQENLIFVTENGRSALSIANKSIVKNNKKQENFRNKLIKAIRNLFDEIEWSNKAFRQYLKDNNTKIEDQIDLPEIKKNLSKEGRGQRIRIKTEKFKNYELELPISNKKSNSPPTTKGSDKRSRRPTEKVKNYADSKKKQNYKNKANQQTKMRSSNKNVNDKLEDPIQVKSSHDRSEKKSKKLNSVFQNKENLPTTTTESKKNRKRKEEVTLENKSSLDNNLSSKGFQNKKQKTTLIGINSTLSFFNGQNTFNIHNNKPDRYNYDYNFLSSLGANDEFTDEQNELIDEHNKIIGVMRVSAWGRMSYQVNLEDLLAPTMKFSYRSKILTTAIMEGPFKGKTLFEAAIELKNNDACALMWDFIAFDAAKKGEVAALSTILNSLPYEQAVELISRGAPNEIDNGLTVMAIAKKYNQLEITNLISNFTIQPNIKNCEPLATRHSSNSSQQAGQGIGSNLNFASSFFNHLSHDHPLSTPESSEPSSIRSSAQINPLPTSQSPDPSSSEQTVQKEIVDLTK